jgi:DNA modification methylase
MKKLRTASIDLVMTSPPFGLVRKKDYGNVAAGEYLDWFRPFAEQMHRILKDTGSLVIDIGEPPHTSETGRPISDLHCVPHTPAKPLPRTDVGN